MTLREEIEEIMNDLCLEHDDSLTIIAVQKIIKKFEKRIDSRLDELKQKMKVSQKLHPNNLSHTTIARIDELKKIKEMLG